MDCFGKLLRPAFTIGALTVLAGCQGAMDSMFPKDQRPIPQRLVEAMEEKGMTAASPIAIRIFKLENQLEVWKQAEHGRFDLLESYEICRWSGHLGPKYLEGDRQAPEGFYTVRPAQMNPKSDYHLSFNIGYPNAYDRAHDRTGSHLMVHGDCSSAGCYSMTDERVEEIYALAREAFKGGQKAFQIQAYPFRMTPENLAAHAGHEQFEFWQMLKRGHDHFEITRYPPKVDVCDRRYVFNRIAEEGGKFRSRQACPPTTTPESLMLAYAEKQETDQKAFDLALERLQREQTLQALLKGQPAAAPVSETTAGAPASDQAPVDDAMVAVAHEVTAIPVPRPVDEVAPIEGPPAPKKPGGLFGWLVRN